MCQWGSKLAEIDKLIELLGLNQNYYRKELSLYKKLQSLRRQIPNSRVASRAFQMIEENIAMMGLQYLEIRKRKECILENTKIYYKLWLGIKPHKSKT